MINRILVLNKETRMFAPFRAHTPYHLKHSVGTFIRQFYKLRLRPGDKLDIIEAKMLRSFRKSMKSYPSEGIESFNDDLKAHSMLEWIRTSFLDAATIALYGEKLLEIESNFKEDFLAFDQTIGCSSTIFPKFYRALRINPRRKFFTLLQPIIVYHWKKGQRWRHSFRTSKWSRGEYPSIIQTWPVWPSWCIGRGSSPLMISSLMTDEYVQNQ